MKQDQNDNKNDVINVLIEKIPSLKCPMCQGKSFTLTDGYYANFVQDSVDNVMIGGRNLPTVGIICRQCGFLSQHAVGVLNLLNNKKEDGEKEAKK